MAGVCVREWKSEGGNLEGERSEEWHRMKGMERDRGRGRGRDADSSMGRKGISMRRSARIAVTYSAHGGQWIPTSKEGEEEGEEECVRSGASVEERRMVMASSTDSYECGVVCHGEEEEEVREEEEEGEEETMRRAGFEGGGEEVEDEEEDEEGKKEDRSMVLVR